LVSVAVVLNANASPVRSALERVTVAVVVAIAVGICYKYNTISY
jgi:hypothetical protein